MANDLTFTQTATILNSIVSQATGKAQITPTDTYQFVNVGQLALQAGYDNTLQAISQVLSKTVFANRAYDGKFKTLEVSNQKYGNHMRKLKIADKTFVNDETVVLTDGDSPDMYVIKKPEVVQLNWYGYSGYQDYITLFQDQLDVAFTGPEEFARFVTMVMTNMNNRLIQARENMARATVSNLIQGTVALNRTESIVHLVTEYNAYAGTSLTAQTVMQPDNFVPFTKWMFARIRTISELLTERTEMYHTNITGKETNQFTPHAEQKLYLNNQILENIDASVLSGVFSPEYLKMPAHETINFWQSIKSPTSISSKPSYMNASGVVVNAAENVVTNNVIGVLFDSEAAGYTIRMQRSVPTRLNARALYSNLWFHEQYSYWNDFGENCVVFCLD